MVEGEPEVIPNVVTRLIEMDQESPKRIMVVGDAMLDSYIQGRLEDCQEGCKKFIEESHTTVPGGAANAANSLKHWKSEVRQLMPLVSGAVKTRFMVGDTCVFRYDHDKANLDLVYAHSEILFTIEDWYPHAVLISDYDKGLLTPEFIRKLIDTCKEKGIICVADCKREPDLYAGEGVVLKGNKQWYDRYRRVPMERWYGTLWVTTSGHKSPFGHSNDDVWVVRCKDANVKCVNHVGAGDCFAAHLTLALAHGLSLKEAAAVAHAAGRVYVQHRYNEPPKLEDIEADMASW